MDLSITDPSSQPTNAVQNGALPVTNSAATETKGPVDPSLNPRLRTLIAREREMFTKRQQYKETETAAEKYARLTKLAQEDPESALSELGLDYDKVTEARLLNPEEKRARQLEARIGELQKRLDSREEKETQNLSAYQEQQARAQIDSLITGSDDFELVAAYGDHDLILATQKLYEKQSGTKASLEEVSRWVETERESQLEKILNSKKAKARFEAQSKPPVDPAGQQAAAQVIGEAKPSFTSTPVPGPGESKTLSNDLTGGTAPKGAATSISALRARALEELKKAF